MSSVSTSARQPMEHYATFLPSRSVGLLLICLCAIICAQAQTVSNNTDQSWTATTVLKGTGGSLRTTEKYSKSGGKTLYKKHVEVVGSDGYRPSFEIEKETVQEDGTTTRSTERTYSRDVNGKNQLVQVTEEETKQLPNGESTVVRTTSEPAPEGGLRIVKREVVETRKSGAESQESETSIYLGDNGGNTSRNLAPVGHTYEQRRRSENGNIEKTKTTKLVDFGAGGLKLAEVREKVVKQDGKNRTTEEKVSRPDFEGNLAEVSRTFAKNTQDHEQNVETAETYSLDVPGRARDGQLHLIQRVTTVRGGDAGRTTTEQQIEQIDPDGLDFKVMTKISDVVTSGPGGTEETRTTRVRNSNGNFSVTSVEEVKSDQPPGIEPHSSPSTQSQ